MYQNVWNKGLQAPVKTHLINTAWFSLWDRESARVRKFVQEKEKSRERLWFIQFKFMILWEVYFLNKSTIFF